MSFRKDVDSYIDECLEEGILPTSDVANEILEVSVAGPQAGPRSNATPGPGFHAGPPGAGKMATMKDYEAPPRFARASQRTIPAARFASASQRVVPAARFTSADKLEDIAAAVFADMEALEEDPVNFNQEDTSGVLESRALGAAFRIGGKAGRKVAKRVATAPVKHPFKSSLALAAAGGVGSKYEKHQEKKALARGDKKAAAKHALRRKIARSALAAPAVAVAGKSLSRFGKHGEKAIDYAQLAKNAKNVGNIKNARKLADQSRGHKVKAAAHLAGYGAGVHVIAGSTDKTWGWSQKIRDKVKAQQKKKKKK